MSDRFQIGQIANKWRPIIVIVRAAQNRHVIGVLLVQRLVPGLMAVCGSVCAGFRPRAVWHRGGDNGLGEFLQAVHADTSEPLAGIVRQVEGIQQRWVVLDDQAVLHIVVKQGEAHQVVEAVTFALAQRVLPPRISAVEAEATRPGEDIHDDG